MPSKNDHQIGDLVFCHSKGLVGGAIRLGQWLRNPQQGWWQYNHVAVIDGWDEAAQDFTIIQARAAGVTRGDHLSTVSPGGFYEVVPFPGDANLPDFIHFLRSQVGDKYGFFTDVCIGVNVLTPKAIKMDIRHDGTWICSGVTAGSLWFAGWEPMVDVSDIYQVTPSELYGLVQKSRKGK